MYIMFIQKKVMPLIPLLVYKRNYHKKVVIFLAYQMTFFIHACTMMESFELNNSILNFRLMKWDLQSTMNTPS